MAESFDSFMERRKAAALAYTKGDGGPVDALTAHSGAVSFFGPDGHSTTGPAAVRKSFADGAAQFEPKGDSQLEILQQGADGDIGYWSGIQHAKVQMKGRDKPMPMDLRITELFRRESAGWRLVHRHADMLKG